MASHTKLWNRFSIAAGIALALVAIFPSIPASLPKWAVGETKGTILYCSSVVALALTWFICAVLAESVRDAEEGLMLEHGLRGNVSIDDLRSAVVRTLEVIQEVAPAEIADMLIKKIRPIWRMGG